ncbi:MAG: histone deacetylase family protein [Desulfurococcus sp.]|nr:histone deacetylase family protein [Desulfurococcus sp.]
MARILISANSMRMHKPRYPHPENPERISRIIKGLKKKNVEPEFYEPRLEPSEALRVAREIHSEDYIERLLQLSKATPVDLDPDTYLSEDSLTLALESFYTSFKLAADARGEIIFYVARPPGHHAGFKGKARGARTQGFCILNNAVAAVRGFMYNGLKRIALLDFDAHYGNGSIELLYTSRVLQVDLHQDTRTLPVFPRKPGEIGEGDGRGLKVGIPLKPYTSDDSYTRVLELAWRLVEEYSPEALVVSAGFDGFMNDGLTDLALTEYSYYRIGGLIRSLGVKTLIVLEGGYSSGLVRGLPAFMQGLQGVKVEYPVKESPKTVREANARSAERAVRIAEKYIR